MSDTPKLTRVHRLDSITLDKTYFTEEGYLVDEPIVTSVGIFEYKTPDGGIRRELRLPEHVFDKESLATYEGKPVIITHDAGRVDKDNVDDENVGTMLSKGYRDGDDVRVKIVIHSIDAVKSSGLRELSLGYDLALDETPGEWKGQPYDAIQTEIKINHLALVGDARAGSQARLNIDGDTISLKGAKSMAKKKGKAMSSEEMKKSIAAFNARRKQRLDEEDPEDAAVDNEEDMDEENMDQEGSVLTGEIERPEVATEPSDRIEFIKNRRDRRDQEGDPDTPEAALGIIAQQDEDIDDLIEIIEELQAKSDFDSSCKDEDEKEDEEDEDEESEGGGVTLKIQTDAMDAIVRERLRLGRLGDQLNLDGLEDMKPMAAKKAIINKVNPSMRLDGKSRTYINAAFDAAVAQLNTSGKGKKDVNYQRRQMSNRADGRDFAPTGKTSAARARERMIERMMNGGNEE